MPPPATSLSASWPRSRCAAAATPANPYAQVSGEFDVDALRRGRGAGAAAPPRPAAHNRRRRRGGDRPAEKAVCEHPCGSPASPTAPSCTTRACGTSPGRSRPAGRPRPPAPDGPVDGLSLQAAFTHEEPLLVEALELHPTVSVNPSGGPAGGQPDHGHRPRAHRRGRRRHPGPGVSRTVGHSTSARASSRTLRCVLEAGPSAPRSGTGGRA